MLNCPRVTGDTVCAVLRPFNLRSLTKLAGTEFGLISASRNQFVKRDMAVLSRVGNVRTNKCSALQNGIQCHDKMMMAL